MTIKGGLKLLAAISFTGVLGCLKEPKKDLDYGPEISQDKVARELQTAIGMNDSPGLIRKEEFVGRETTQLIRGRAVLDILNTTEVTVVERTETARQWQIRDVQKVQSYDPADRTNTPPPIITEDHKCWNKGTMEREECEIGFFSHHSRPTNSEIADRLKPLSHFQQGSMAEVRRFTYHNLSISKYQAPPPAAVANDPECRGIPNCLINITHLEFDQVNWTKDPEGYKVHYSIKVSQDVPQLSRFLESCQQGSVQVIQPGQDPKSAPRFLVTMCETVKNFIPGQ